jgi:ABC-type glycerol-3-phosphate transport system substrate-binding protein
MKDMDQLYERPLTRREVVKGGIALGSALGAAPIIAACGSSKKKAAAVSTKSLKGSGKVVIGAFQDDALIPFKEKIVPLFKKETGISIQFLEDAYDTFFEKAFNDGRSKAGTYDLYVMDDPWIPQYAAGGILEDLGAQGLKLDSDFLTPFADLGYWPPRSGPRVKGFESQTPKLVAVPFIGDLQTLTYRNDVFSSPPKTWDELVAGAKKYNDPSKKHYGYVFRGVSGNPIVTSWYPIFLSFGGQFFDDKWNPTFNSADGKAAGEFFVKTLKSLAPPGVVEFDSDQEGGAILGGQAAAIIQYTGNAIKSDNPKESKVVGKLDFATVPKKKKAIAQVGIFISGVSTSARNKENAVKFQKWFALKQSQLALARAGAVPVRRSAFEDATAQKKNRLLPVALKQADSGAEARPRTPDWGKVEELLGIQLNKALQRGSLGNALDVAATNVRSYLKRQGYYS